MRLTPTTSNLIVTGIPRAGTTLVAALVDALEDSFCINEPHWQARWSREAATREEYVSRLVDDFAVVRERLRSGGSVEVRWGSGGRAITDFFESPHGRRRRKRALEVVAVSRSGLSADFLLGMKHNAHYTCVLPELVSLPDISVLAIVRHPVAVLLSWRSVRLPVSRARLPAAEPFWPAVRQVSRRAERLLTKQAKLIELFFARYHAHRDAVSILRYEDVSQHPSLLTDLAGRTAPASVGITASRVRASASRRDIEKIEECVRRHCPTAANYYSSLQPA